MLQELAGSVNGRPANDNVLTELGAHLVRRPQLTVPNTWQSQASTGMSAFAEHDLPLTNVAAPIDVLSPRTRAVYSIASAATAIQA